MDWLDRIAALLKKLWKRSGALAVIAGAFISFALAEAGQSGLLGEAVLRVASRFVPWQPLLDQSHSTEAVFSIRIPAAQGFSPIVSKQRCPVGSTIQVQYERSGHGWVSIIDSNRTGIQAIPINDRSVIEVKEKEPRTATFAIDRSDGHETLFVVGSNKPFDVLADFAPAYRNALEETGKGAAPDVASSLPARFEMSLVAECDS